MRAQAAVAATVYAIVAVALFAPALIPGRTLSTSDTLWSAAPWASSRPTGVRPLGANRDLGDAAGVFQPFLESTRRRLPDVPLWNPYIMAGRPFLANAQSAVFSPFNLPGYLLPLWRALPIVAVLKVLAAAMGAYLLGRALGMRFAGALIAGAIFGFSLWMVSWVAWPTTNVWALLPWICWLTELLIRRRDPLTFAGLSLVVALQYAGGHPESSFHVLLFAVAFWLIRVAPLRSAGPRALAGQAATFAGALVAGTALAAAALLPLAELLHHSIDAESRRALGNSHQPPAHLLGVFLHDYWGRQTRFALEFSSALEESAYYVGALTLMLACAALVLRRRREDVAFAVLGLASLAIAAGLPPLFGAVSALPVFDASHNWRMAVFFVLAAALLAGRGLDALMGPAPAAGRRRWVLAVCGALACFPLVVVALGGYLSPDRLGSALRVAWGFADPTLPPGHPFSEVAETVRLASLLEWLVFAVAAVALVALRLRGRLGAPAFAALSVALVVLDLLKAGVGYNPAIRTDLAGQPTTPAIRYLQSLRPARFAGIDPSSSLGTLYPLPPDVAMRYRLFDARGYDFPIERRYALLWRTHVARSPDCNYMFCSQSVDTRPDALRALGLLGVTALVQGPDDPPLDAPGVRLAYSGADARVYRNPLALPRAFLVARQRVVTDEERALAAVTSPAFRARSTAVVERPLPGLATEGAAPDRSAGEARIASYGAEDVRVDVGGRERALLVLTDTWFPGWRATVDGRGAPVRRVDYLLRGVEVPPGRHRVELRYEPASWRVGWIVSLLALVGLAAAAITPVRRRVAAAGARVRGAAAARAAGARPPRRR